MTRMLLLTTGIPIQWSYYFPGRESVFSQSLGPCTQGTRARFQDIECERLLLDAKSELDLFTSVSNAQKTTQQFESVLVWLV